MGLTWSGRNAPEVETPGDPEAPADTASLVVEDHSEERFKQCGDEAAELPTDSGVLLAGLTAQPSRMSKIHVTGKVTVFLSTTGGFVVVKDHV